MSIYKVHPDLKQTLATADPNVAVPVIVRYRRMRGDVGMPQAVAGLAVRMSSSLLSAVVVDATPQQVLALAQDARVERVWPDLPVHTMLDHSVPLIGAPQVWSESGAGAGVRVAVLDTGCDLDHPDLREQIRAHIDLSDKGSAQDGNGHGTHVAGIIAGSGAASDGKYRGVAPGVDLYIAKVLDDGGGGRMSAVIAGLDWAVQQEVQIVNLSLGSDSGGDGADALSEACDAAVAAGMIVIAAAGNAGPEPRTVGAPGCARDAITIGGSALDDTIASFSAHGPTLDGRVKPDVVFPGRDIVAARAAHTSLGKVVDDFYTKMSGTSMATPHASGAVALLLEVEPDLTPQQVKDRLMATAVDLGADPNAQGAGRGDIEAAWKAGQSTRPPKPTPPSPTPLPVTPPTPVSPLPTPPPPPSVTPTPPARPKAPLTPGGCLLPVLSGFALP